MHLHLLILTLLLLPLSTFAQEYSTLINSSLNRSDGIGEFLNTIYIIAISAAAIFAVLKIILAGVKYMLSDVVTNKESAKQDIKTALLGLIIIVSAVLILQTINPKLVKFELQFEKPTSIGRLSVGALNPIEEAFEDWQPDECAQLRRGEEGRVVGAGINATACESDLQSSILREFNRRCSAAGGTSLGGFGVRSCVVDAARSERWGLDEYADDDADLGEAEERGFVEYNLNQVTINALGYCENKASRQEIESGDVASCVENVSDAFYYNDDIGTYNTYCENNAGKRTSPRNSDSMTCTLPTRTFTWEEANEETGTVLSKEQFGQVCADRNMELVDTLRVWANNGKDYVCASYAND